MPPLSYFSTSLRADPAELAGIAATVLAHIAVVLFLFTHAPAREALSAMAPLMVELIKPEPPAPPRPQPKVEQLPKPLPVKRVQPQVEKEQPILAAQTALPNAAPTIAQVPVQPEPKPAPTVLISAEVKPVPPAQMIPPNFNANYLDNPAPSYPALSRRLGEEGRVMLRVLVEADGLPLKLEVRTSSGYERLDQSALDAVRRWKFIPAKQGDKAVAAWVVVPILFNLNG